MRCSPDRGAFAYWKCHHAHHLKPLHVCRPIPGNHGSLTLFYARITDIAVGVIIVLLFDLVMPWSVIIPTRPSITEVPSVNLEDL